MRIKLQFVFFEKKISSYCNHFFSSLVHLLLLSIFFYNQTYFYHLIKIKSSYLIQSNL